MRMLSPEYAPTSQHNHIKRVALLPATTSPAQPMPPGSTSARDSDVHPAPEGRTDDQYTSLPTPTQTISALVDASPDTPDRTTRTLRYDARSTDCPIPRPHAGTPSPENYRRSPSWPSTPTPLSPDLPTPWYLDRWLQQSRFLDSPREASPLDDSSRLPPHPPHTPEGLLQIVPWPALPMQLGPLPIEPPLARVAHFL